jgi:anti-sigma B factor antagonist
MSFTIARAGGIVVLNVSEQLARPSRDDLKRSVMAEVDRGERRFLIDFRQTGFIDSSGLGALIAVSRKLSEVGGELRLANLNEDLRTLFALTKLDTLFEIVRDDGVFRENEPSTHASRPRGHGTANTGSAVQRQAPNRSGS